MFGHPRSRLAAVLLAATALVAACGDDDEDVSATPGDQEPASSTTSAAPAGETINVVGVDYAFEGLPAEISVGTKVNFTNGTKANELHEFVAVRIPDTETRSVSELFKLPEAELDAVFGSGPPAAVLLAPPGGAPVITAVGDGTFTQTGRYAVACFIPTGADPAEYLAAAQSAGDEGPPDVKGGPPHVANGMFAEVKVK